MALVENACMDESVSVEHMCDAACCDSGGNKCIESRGCYASSQTFAMHGYQCAIVSLLARHASSRNVHDLACELTPGPNSGTVEN